MMTKTQYILELKTEKPLVKKGHDHPLDVRKVQEWINLWKRYDSNWKISTRIDGDFGPSTEISVKEFQTFHGLVADGLVGKNTWRKLTEPMIKAFSRINETLGLADMIVAYAKQHLASSPREFNQNEGTWVRSYMDGNEGAPWAWCLGFVQTICDQATYTLGTNLESMMPQSYSCDVLGNYGLDKKKLIRNVNLKDQQGNLIANKIKPGDIFLNVKTPLDWTHTGIVTAISGNWIETIEGNTNDEGSREGYEVCARKRNIATKNIDIFSV